MKDQTVRPTSKKAPQTEALKHMIDSFASLCVRTGHSPATIKSLFQGSTAFNIPRSETQPSEASDIFMAGEVLSQWHEKPDYLMSDGTPAALSEDSDLFMNLCKQVSSSIDCAKILDLLVTSGAVARVNGHIIPLRRAVIVNRNDPAAVERTIKVLTVFLSTLNHNLSRTDCDPGIFERSVASTKISHKYIPALLAYMNSHGQSFLEDLDSWLVARETADQEKLVGVGLYLFTE
jgi:hypothetical protein